MKGHIFFSGRKMKKMNKIKKKIVSLALCAAVLGLTAGPCFAAGASAGGAARVKTLFTQWLNEQKQTVEMDGQTKLIREGDLIVEPVDTYYAVTLPVTKIQYPDGSYLDLGMISINASEDTAPGRWKMSIAAPPSIALMNAAGQVGSRLTIGTQKTSGIWDEAGQIFTKFDGVYTNLALEEAASHTSISIPALHVSFDLKKDALGKLSGPSLLSFQNLSATAQDGLNVHIDNAETRIDVDQYDAVQMRKYRAQLKAAGSPPQIEALSQSAADILTKAMNGFRSSYTVSGLSVHAPATAGAPARDIRLARAAARIDMADLLQAKSRLGFLAEFDGLAVMPEPKGYEDLIPEKSHIAFDMDNLPAKDLQQLWYNSAAGLQSPDTRQLMAMALMMKIPALLSQAGAKITIPESFIGNKKFGVKASGHGVADPKAASSMTIDMKALFQGLDPLIALARARSAGNDPALAQGYKNFLAQLQTVKTYARPAGSGLNGPDYTLDFQLDGQGRILINGQDIQAAGKTKP